MKLQTILTCGCSILFGFYSAQNGAEAACAEQNQFDYIIVGSGSTGATIAARLSEIDDIKVLLIEAGVEPTHKSEIPLISYESLHTDMDWNYTSVPQETCCHMFNDAKIAIPRGKCLGGTSSINFMTYTRGFRDDFNHWKSQGNEGWGWDDIYPYMLKLEDYRAPIPNRENERFHQTGGPMTVEIPTFKTPMAQTWLDAGKELGYRNDIDYNAEDQIGFMYPPVNTRNYSRCSTYVAYILPAMTRKNFFLEKGALVTKILIDENKTATGVQYQKNGKTCTANARKEVIISAGTIGSPKLLMLSGIGPQDQLKEKGIKAIRHLPGVGENYQDHVVMGGIEYYINTSVTYNSVRYENDHYIQEWEQNRTGPMQCPESFEGVAYLSTDSEKPTWPDIEIFFNSDNVARVLLPYLKPLFREFIPTPEKDVVSMLPILLRPKSRGTVKLASSDPLESPLIDPRLLSDPKDVETLTKAIQIANKIAKTQAFQRYNALPITWDVGTSCSMPQPLASLFAPFDSMNWLTCATPLLSTSGFHPVGTCKMGPENDDMAVVDNHLRVYGLKNLRVADASVMPNVVAAHTSIPCIAIGEKIADEIKAEWT